ncbi:glycerol kinase GlpK [Dehalobacter sp. DCM]|uniref:glycerol kinase GlpK n=1 Tax=Dehalobacter sp. DCM TaxID=2907827 RepID=UPI0030813B83|nr:glycerol kinase GlpK [Dehalobacter sp. DCM]
MPGKVILALDQGTTSSRAILFDENGTIIGQAQKEFTQIYPHPGWVEHDPMEIWQTQLSAARDVLAQTGTAAESIHAIGIANQRETTVVWNRTTGEPVCNAIVWQCRRTTPLCEEIKNGHLNTYIEEMTGLIVDAYFSGTKIRWILDHIPDGQKLAERGDLIFGTIDSWLVWKLTSGRLHITDYSNASRTMLYNIRDLRWDDKILAALDIPECILPKVCPSSDLFGVTEAHLLGAEIPIGGLAGDQQAALFGQGCFSEGMVKNTYGTGCFILMNTGKNIIRSKNKLLTTIAWGIDNQVEYALEGSVFIGGAVVQWLRDEMGLIQTAAESEYVATQVKDTNGVYVVPAFVGLGAPYWDMQARGIITGLTRGANRSHLIRAALESIVYQTNDVLTAMDKDTGILLRALMVDGGGAANHFLLQFQADISKAPVIPSAITETTALGAAYLAGLASGYWSGKDDLGSGGRAQRIFQPQITEQQRREYLNGWQKAVERARCHQD